MPSVLLLLRRTTRGAARKSLGTTTKYPRRTTSAAEGQRPGHLDEAPATHTSAVSLSWEVPSSYP